MSQEISQARRTMYYTGMGCIVMGVLLFLSTFFTAFSSSKKRLPPGSEFTDMHRAFEHVFEQRSSEFDASLNRGLIGFGFILAGGVLMNLGVRGFAGSGLVLDPKQARQDLQPWSKMTGGMVQDVISEIDLSKTLGLSEAKQAPVVKVRCGRCQSLNDEASKFCNQCGSAI